MRLRRWQWGLFCLTVACLFLPAGLAAQGASPLSQAIQSYQNLDYETSSDLLRRSIDRATLPPAQMDEALSYLGASEFFLGHREAAASVFRDKLNANPRGRLDALIFPPEVQRVFEEVRRSVKLVDIEVPREAEVRIGTQPMTIRLFASSYHDVAVGIATGSGHVVRWLYSGPIADSIDLSWDGRDAAQTVFKRGSYTLRVSSKASGRTIRTVEIPLTVVVEQEDTVPLPRAPDASQLLPERGRSGLLNSAARGVALGIAVLALPAIAGVDSIDVGAPLLVGLAIGTAGAAGLVMHPSGKPIESNIAYNRQLKESYERRLEAAIEENRRRRGDIKLTIRTGEPDVSEGSNQ
jgi:hypothetical protein